jgi:hypothetical protein
MWKAILKKQQQFYDEGRLSAFDLAATYGQLGMKPQALHYLDVSLANREPQIVALHDATLFAGLRQETAFQALMARLDLP